MQVDGMVPGCLPLVYAMHMNLSQQEQWRQHATDEESVPSSFIHIQSSSNSQVWCGTNHRSDTIITNINNQQLVYGARNSPFGTYRSVLYIIIRP